MNKALIKKPTAQYVALDDIDFIYKRGTKDDLEAVTKEVVSCVCALGYRGHSPEDIVIHTAVITSKHRKTVFDKNQNHKQNEKPNVLPKVVYEAVSIIRSIPEITEVYVDSACNLISFVSGEYSRKCFRNITKLVISLEDSQKYDFIYFSKKEMLEKPPHDFFIQAKS